VNSVHQAKSESGRSVHANESKYTVKSPIFHSHSPLLQSSSLQWLATLFFCLTATTHSSHIFYSLSSNCFYHIRDVRRIRLFIDFKTACIIDSSIMHSKLDYCNSLFHSFRQTQILIAFISSRMHLPAPPLELASCSG
jgi:hypothetical protein